MQSRYLDFHDSFDWIVTSVKFFIWFWLQLHELEEIARIKMTSSIPCYVFKPLAVNKVKINLQGCASSRLSPRGGDERHYCWFWASSRCKGSPIYLSCFDGHLKSILTLLNRNKIFCNARLRYGKRNIGLHIWVIFDPDAHKSYTVKINTTNATQNGNWNLIFSRPISAKIEWSIYARWLDAHGREAGLKGKYD